VRIYPPTKKDIKYYLPLARKLNSRRYPDRENNLSQAIHISFSYLYPTPYFANEDKIKWDKNNGNLLDTNESNLNELKFAVFSHQLIKVEILSFNSIKINNKSLLEMIENYIVEFFITHNFGNRQNKGFGSFTISTLEQKSINNYEINKYFDYVKKLNSNNGNLSEIFKKIDKIYKKIKNNSMNNGSIIRDYFINKDINWEKKAVNTKLIQKNELDSNSKYEFVRALLGLAMLHDYRQLNKKVWITHNGVGDKQIERFQSPLFFKVIGNTIYLCASKNNLVDKITGQEFWFYHNDTYLADIKKIKNLNVAKRLLLEVPSDFNIVQFMNDITDKIN
jgi:hypothetical protein